MTKLTKLNLFKLPELTGDVSSLSGMTELKSLNLFVLPELTGDVSSFRVDRSVGAHGVILMFQIMPRFQQFGYDIKCCRVHPLAYARFIRILVLFQPLISGLVNSPSRTQPWRMNSFRNGIPSVLTGIPCILKPVAQGLDSMNCAILSQLHKVCKA